MLLIYGPAVVTSFIFISTHWLRNDPVQKSWGWGLQSVRNPLLSLIIFYFSLAALLALYLCFNFYRRRSDGIPRKQAGFALIGFSIPVVVASMSEAVLPSFSVRLPELTTAAVRHRQRRLHRLRHRHIDHFKEFNDRFGHESGDAALQAIGSIIRGELREMDVAARFGGEEFLLILPEATCKQAVSVAERLRVRVMETAFTLQPAQGRSHMTISIGVASTGEGTDNKDQLVSSADKALYIAKKNGRNRVEAIKARVRR